MLDRALQTFFWNLLSYPAPSTYYDYLSHIAFSRGAVLNIGSCNMDIWIFLVESLSWWDVFHSSCEKDEYLAAWEQVGTAKEHLPSLRYRSRQFHQKDLPSKNQTNQLPTIQSDSQFSQFSHELTNPQPPLGFCVFFFFGFIRCICRSHPIPPA